MKLFIPVLGLALGLMGCQEDKSPRPAQPPQSLVKGLFDFTRVPPPPVPVTPPPVPALRPVLFPDPAPLLREERARALRGVRQGRVIQELKALPEPAPVKPRLQDEDYQRWEDATFAATTSTLPVERTRMLTADMRIPALLEDALISHIGGRVIALVERDVLNPEGKVILLPAYSRLICQYKPLEPE